MLEYPITAIRAKGEGREKRIYKHDIADESQLGEVKASPHIPAYINSGSDTK